MFDTAILELVEDAEIRDIVDDAVRWLALGYSAEEIALLYPEHTDVLYPLLLVIEGLHDLSLEDEAKLREVRERKVDWPKVLPPQVALQP